MKNLLKVLTDYLRFLSYDSNWERTLFDNVTGGYLVTSLLRIQEANKSKNNLMIYLKEQKMCRKLVSFGFQIEHLYEVPGVSSPDIALKRHGCIVKIGGRLAELKQLSSSNKIYNEGKNAKYNKKADLIIFEFTKQSSGIFREIGRLTGIGIHGYYYYTDSKMYCAF